MKIVSIPPKMERFYGSGSMLHPDRFMVEDLIRKIPQGRIVFIETLCKKMAEDHGTNISCPMRTTNFIKKIIAESTSGVQSDPIPFWRVTRNNHKLINYPNLETGIAALQKEGVQVRGNNKGEFEVCHAGDLLFSFTEV